MNRGVKMAVMARQADEKRRSGGEGYTYPSDNNDRPEMNYGDTEARFRDRTGREHYDDGRFAPRGGMDEPEDGTGLESRRYRRDDAGRFRSEYPYTPLVPPVYRNGGMEMNRIGFALEPRRELDHDYRTDANYPRMDEMGHRTSPVTMGHAKATGMTLTREMAEEWMRGLRNEDGSKGPHWTLEQIKQVIAQRGIDCDPVKLWVAMNAEYSDRSEVNKKHKVNTIDFYLDSAIASWLNDKDAVGDKEAAYFRYIVMPDA